jgi:hypothetical protein
MSDQFQIEPSDLFPEWIMVRRTGYRTHHFRTREEAERHVTKSAGCGQIAKPGEHAAE